VLASSGLAPEVFRRFAKLTQGTRRALRLGLADLALGMESTGLRLSFSLPAGAYATSVLRELLWTTEAGEDPGREAEEGGDPA